MKYILIIISLLSVVMVSYSQDNIESILKEIEKNNTMLSALRSKAEAEKLGNKTGIYLQNPEVEFHYLWSNPSTIGNRTDFSIKQSFDFPTAYNYRNQISDLKNKQVELEYKKQLMELLLQTQNICLDLIHTNSLLSEYEKRLDHVQIVADSYKAKYNIGESNILEFNKSQLSLLNINNALENIKIRRAVLLSELVALNGGKPLDFNFKEFPLFELPEDFENWYIMAENNNPILVWLKQEIEVSNARVKHSKAMSLPKIGGGYMSEKIVGEQFQGLIVGLTIPLWENKNTVKYAKGNAIAYESIIADRKLQYYNHLKTMHAKAISLKKRLIDYRSNLLLFNSYKLLSKALENGQISLIEYNYELSVYYESIDSLLDLELELSKTVAELNQFI